MKFQIRSGMPTAESAVPDTLTERQLIDFQYTYLLIP